VGGSLRGSAADGEHKDRSLQVITTLDVLVPWTNHAECRNSGLARGCTLTAQTEVNMRARIDLAVTETNTAYAESGIDALLNLVHAYRTDYTEASSDAFGSALSATRASAEVGGKRTLYGADVVALIIDDSQYCGIGYLGPRTDLMFSVTAWNCATGYFSFGHEIGHNLGCNHDRGTTGKCTTDTSAFNYGWRDPATDFRSILAYGCGNNRCSYESTGGCTRVQRFSNDEFLYNSKAIGSATADNARHINGKVVEVAGYFSSGTPPPTSEPTPVPTPAPTNPPEPTPPPVPVPTNEPTTGAPTPVPTPGPTNEPTTGAPTPVPTTAAPTPATTPNPTASCNFANKKACQRAGCGWNNRRKRCT